MSNKADAISKNTGIQNRFELIEYVRNFIILRKIMLNYDYDKVKFPIVYDNKRGITDRDEWEITERDLAEQRIVQLLNNPKLVKQSFDGVHLSELHRYIFQDCYDWAGSFRDNGNQISIFSSTETRQYDGIEYTAIYTPDSMISARMEEVNKVIRDKCSGRNARIDLVLSILSAVSDRIIEIHPFRRGNNRVRRVFLAQVAERIGFKLDFTLIDPEELNKAEFLANAVSHAENAKQLNSDERVEMLKELYRPLLVLLPKEQRTR